VHSAKHRHQSLEWTILSHVYWFFQAEVIRFQVLLDNLHPHSMRAFGGLLQFSEGEAITIYLVSVSSGIHAMWLNREKRRKV